MVTVQRSESGHRMTAQQMLWQLQQTRRARPCASGYRYFPFEQSSGYRYFRHTPGGMVPKTRRSRVAADPVTDKYASDQGGSKSSHTYNGTLALAKPSRQTAFRKTFHPVTGKRNRPTLPVTENRD